VRMRRAREPPRSGVGQVETTTTNQSIHVRPWIDIWQERLLGRQRAEA
jgi:hypothetical protein